MYLFFSVAQAEICTLICIGCSNLHASTKASIFFFCFFILTSYHIAVIANIYSKNMLCKQNDLFGYELMDFISFYCHSSMTMMINEGKHFNQEKKKQTSNHNNKKKQVKSYENSLANLMVGFGTVWCWEHTSRSYSSEVCQNQMIDLI